MESRIIDSVRELSEDTLYFTYKQIEDILKEQGYVQDHFFFKMDEDDDDYYKCIEYSYIRKSTEQEVEKERLKVEKTNLEKERQTRKSKERDLLRLAKELNFIVQENGK